jgi:hypothetical protein
MGHKSTLDLGRRICLQEVSEARPHSLELLFDAFGELSRRGHGIGTPSVNCFSVAVIEAVARAHCAAGQRHLG